MKSLVLLTILFASSTFAQGFPPVNLGEDCGGFIGIPCAAGLVCKVDSASGIADAMGKCVSAVSSASIEASATTAGPVATASGATGTASVAVTSAKPATTSITAVKVTTSNASNAPMAIAVGSIISFLFAC
ncbi:UNVERIFIED_CONTAM: hypothetical protein HDU68_004257 [Siphonaria sp. JEL0065]|nr:hypothetical protein HDU68_004257 [Siphonaria sp. JEL0065]